VIYSPSIVTAPIHCICELFIFLLVTVTYFKAKFFVMQYAERSALECFGRVLGWEPKSMRTKGSFSATSAYSVQTRLEVNEIANELLETLAFA
jgi:hypothetical protein